MRRALLLAAAAAAAAGCGLLPSNFRLNGVVDVAPALRARVPRDNGMLFVVAKNRGGVPVAVLRIVNPDFPAEFHMDPADLIVPALGRGEPLTVTAEMNTHGDVGHPRPGDLLGRAPGVFRPGDDGVKILLDKVSP